MTVIVNQRSSCGEWQAYSRLKEGKRRSRTASIPSLGLAASSARAAASSVQKAMVIHAGFGMRCGLPWLAAVLPRKPPPTLVHRLYDAVLIEDDDFGSHGIEDGVLEGFAFLQRFFAISQAVDEVIEAGDEFANFVMAGYRQGFGSCCVADKWERQLGGRKHRRKLPIQYPPRCGGCQQGQ
ncbi:hypothetical protein [Candidatus Accumulibacter sp. ACC012]|uniref:hypothetical protein n=1 Tax=Candidatus Accumulibacter sp. ACC012 TaxID=2823332 RepID=UPI0025BF85EF|nr:hypothetical protein [Candidatus Accumulibacter sp. ACC012]